MKVQIVRVQNHGKPATEHIELKVLSDCNSNYYLLTDTTFTPDQSSISNIFRHTFWFAFDHAWKAGDSIFLFSGTGINSTTKAGTATNWNYYWESGGHVWNDKEDGAVLFQLDTWSAKKIK